MAKKNIHPDYHNVTMVFVNGEERQTRSTFGAEGDRIVLEVDITKHPAWNSENNNFVNESSKAVAKFRKKYGNFDLSQLSKEEENKA